MNSPLLPTAISAVIAASLVLFAASCHAESPTPNPSQRDVAGINRKVPRQDARSSSSPTDSLNTTATASPQPTLSATSSPPSVVGPLDVRFPEKPLQIEARIAPIQATPVQVKPIELRLPKEELHVAVGGIPQPIKIEADMKGVPLDVRWPEKPLDITVNLASKPDDKVSGGRECKCTPVPTTPRDENAHSEVKKLQQEIDDLKRIVDEQKKAEQKILEEAENERKKVEEDRAHGKIPDAEYQKRIKEIDDDKAERMQQVAADAWRTMLGHAVSIIALLAGFGALGGFASSMVEFLRDRRKLLEELRRVKAELEARELEATKSEAPDTKFLSSEQKAAIERRLAEDQERQRRRLQLSARLDQLRWLRWICDYAKWLPPLCLGSVAALMVPIGLLFIPRVSLQTASADPFTFASLCSLCFAVGMIGEPFIEFVLQKLRDLTAQDKKPADAALADEIKPSEPPPPPPQGGRKIEI